jgi:hypothetical protein
MGVDQGDGKLGVSEAADVLGVSPRSVWRLGDASRTMDRGRSSMATAAEPRRPTSMSRPGSGSAPWPAVATTEPTTVISPSCSPSARGSSSAGSQSGGSCGRPASPARDAAAYSATEAAGTGCRRRARCSRPTVRAMTGSRTGVHVTRADPDASENDDQRRDRNRDCRRVCRSCCVSRGHRPIG